MDLGGIPAEPLFRSTIPLQQLNGLEPLVIIMVANKYAFLQITRRRFLNAWEDFKKVIRRRNIRRRLTIPLTLSNLNLLRRIDRKSVVKGNSVELAGRRTLHTKIIKCHMYNNEHYDHQ